MLLVPMILIPARSAVDFSCFMCLCQPQPARDQLCLIAHFCLQFANCCLSIDHQSLPSAFHQLVITGQHHRDLAYSSRNPSK